MNFFRKLSMVGAFALVVGLSAPSYSAPAVSTAGDAGETIMLAQLAPRAQAKANRKARIQARRAARQANPPVQTTPAVPFDNPVKNAPHGALGANHG